jgi:hypothetical protein
MRFAVVPFVLFLSACGTGELVTSTESEKDDRDAQSQAFSSATATLLELELDSELLVPGTISTFSARSYIDQQLLFTIGHLNTHNSVGRLDKVSITNVKVTPQNGSSLVSFHAALPVAWGSKTNLPTSYAFTLPRSMGYAALDTFTAKYKVSCVERRGGRARRRLGQHLVLLPADAVGLHAGRRRRGEDDRHREGLAREHHRQIPRAAQGLGRRRAQRRRDLRQVRRRSDHQR